MFDGMTRVINNRTGKEEYVSKSGLLNLADKIIEDSCTHYLKTNSEREHVYIEDFLRSDYGRALLRNIDPEFIINKMKEVKSGG